MSHGHSHGGGQMEMSTMSTMLNNGSTPPMAMDMDHGQMGHGMMVC